MSRYDEKRTIVVKSDVISSLAMKLSSILCLTKSQNEQLLRFWKAMMVFVNPQCEEITKRIHASYNTCVRQYQSDERQKKQTCQKYFRECAFFSLALDSALIRNEHLLSCFARFSFEDSVIQVPIFFDVCHDQSGNGIAQFVFKKLMENNISFEKLVSVCTDGASSMTGRLGGMIAILKQLVRQHCRTIHAPFEDFSTVWCLAHRLNLVTRDFMDMKGINVVKAFSDWFSDCLRQTTYKTFVAQDSTVKG